MALSNCDIFGCKKSKFIRKEEENGLLSSIRIKTSLSKKYFSCSFVLLIVIMKVLQKESNS